MPNFTKKILNSLAIAGLILAGIAAVPTEASAATWTGMEAVDVLGGKATVRWSTDVATTGVVHYGTDAAQLTSYLGDSRLRTDHEARLIGLNPKTRYFYAITSRDSAGAEVTSFTFSFTTAGKLTAEEENERDANQQAASTANDLVGVDGVAGTAAAISWTSAIPTRGTVQYNELSSTRKRSSARTTLDTGGQVVIKGLKPATTYEYTVTTRDSDGDLHWVRGPFRFTTAENRDQESTPLQVTFRGPASTNDSRLSPTAATVQLSTNHLANATVGYRATTKGVKSSGTTKATRYGFQQQATLSNLKPNTDYEVTVTAKDAFGKTVKLAAQKFRTPALVPATVAAPRVAGTSTGPSGRLVKAAGSSTVYYVYASGRKKPFASEAAFYSYGHRFSDVQTVTDQQLAAIPNVQLVKGTTSQAVYLLEGATLRPIASEAAFLAAGYSWANVELANPTDIVSYTPGAPVA